MTLRRNIVLGALKEALKSLLILLWEEGHILSPLSLSLAFQVRIHANLDVVAQGISPSHTASARRSAFAINTSLVHNSGTTHAEIDSKICNPCLVLVQD